MTIEHPTRFSATDAAFEGFRTARRAPLSLLWWGLAYGLFMAAVMIGGWRNIAEIMSISTALQAGGQPNQSQVTAMMAAYGGIVWWVIPLSLAIGAVVSTAVARSVIQPGEKRLGYMRFGKDELRVLGATVLVALITGLVSLVVFFFVGFLGGLASMAPVLWLLVVVGAIAGLALIIWLQVRFSLVVPATFAEKRIDLKAHFALTKGRVWPLLGMGIIAFVMAMLVGMLLSIVAMPVTMTVGGLEVLADLEGAGFGDMIQKAGPALLASIVLNGVMTATQVGLMYAPFSAAYLGLRREAALRV